jgi:hypothetical protein
MHEEYCLLNCDAFKSGRTLFVSEECATSILNFGVCAGIALRYAYHETFSIGQKPTIIDDVSSTGKTFQF